MSKVDIGVGDEFPLDEPRNDDRSRRHRGRHSHGHHRHGRHGHHFDHGHRRGHHGISRLALLLVAGGIVALLINHQLSAAMAYGMIWAGAGLMMLMVLARALFFAAHMIWHWRQHRRMNQPASQVA